LGGSEWAFIMAAGRECPLLRRCDFSRQTIELGFWTPTGLVAASDFSEGAEAVLPLEGKASCRLALVGSGRRGADDLIAQWREQVIGSQ
jgi:hypothetical protein